MFLALEKLLHRDIKPENYIKFGNVFKLIDFGCVRKSTFTRLKTIGVGTLLFQAPEIMDNKQNYSDKVDVWILACVFYEIFNQNALFNYDDVQTVKQKILNHIDDQSEVNQKISSLNCNFELQNLMKAMLDPKEDKKLKGYFRQINKYIKSTKKNKFFSFIELGQLLITTITKW